MGDNPVIEMSPAEYVQWLITTHGIEENEAKTRVEKLYFKQTGKKIKLFLKPYKNEMVWDYSYGSEIIV